MLAFNILIYLSFLNSLSDYKRDQYYHKGSVVLIFIEILLHVSSPHVLFNPHNTLIL